MARGTFTSFEPGIDCVITNPAKCGTRIAFETCPQAAPTLTTQMKSVSEAMAIGRTLKK
jgi:carbamoyl-phosphate synthase large subunit